MVLNTRAITMGSMVSMYFALLYSTWLHAALYYIKNIMVIYGNLCMIWMALIFIFNFIALLYIYLCVCARLPVYGLISERTYSAPQKWMRGKGRITLQFGCCYNYAIVSFSFHRSLDIELSLVQCSPHHY